MQDPPAPVVEWQALKISVVIPSYNQARFVEETLESVFAQDQEDTEVLFVDGGSTDGTLTLAERYRDQFAYFVSEPDRGQSDAMTKGFAAATGDVLTWLNTDDILLPGALSAVARAFRETPGCEWTLGNVVWIDGDGNIMRFYKGEGWSEAGVRAGRLTAGGPSAFFTSGLLQRAGGIDRDMHYKMDTHLWWRFVASGARYVRLPSYIWALRLHPEAKTSRRGAEAVRRENARIDAVKQAIGIAPPPHRWPGHLGGVFYPARAGCTLDTLRWRRRPLSAYLARQ